MKKSLRVARNGLIILLLSPALALGAVFLFPQIILSVAGSLMKTEGIDWNKIHVLDPKIIWRLRPNLGPFVFSGTLPDGSPLDFRLTTNAMGFRGKPIRPRGPQLRILAIGDSTTFGLGVDDDKTWPAVLESLLQNKGIDAEVINAGVSGYSAFQGLRLLKEHGEKLRPDIVIATFGHTEVERSGPSDIERQAVLGSRLRLLLSIFRDPWQEKTQSLRMSPEEFREAMMALRHECTTINAKLILVAWPNRQECDCTKNPAPGPDCPPADPTYYLLVKEIASTLGVPVLDVLPVMKEQDNIYFDTVHFTEKGNGIVAQHLLATLEALDLLVR